MHLHFCSFAIPRTLLNHSFSTASFLAAWSRSRRTLLGYATGLRKASMSCAVTRNDEIKSYRPSYHNLRITQRLGISYSENVLRAQLYSSGNFPITIFRPFPSYMRRTMCTIRNEDRICWNCKKKIGEEIFFCEICKIIQPPLTELSFFEIFDSEETYDLDLKNLTNRYRKLQTMIHPDKFSNSNEEEKQYSAEQSSLINKAYNILLDPLPRAVYLLGLNNVEIGEGNTVQGQEFLMEVMEINEKLSEVQSLADLDEMRTSNNDSIDCCIESLTNAFEDGDLEAAKELTIKLRYYRNILEIIKEKTMQLDN